MQTIHSHRHKQKTASAAISIPTLIDSSAIPKHMRNCVAQSILQESQDDARATKDGIFDILFCSALMNVSVGYRVQVDNCQLGGQVREKRGPVYSQTTGCRSMK